MCNCRSRATEIKNLSSDEKFVICSHPCRIITHKYQQTHWLHRLVCFLLAWKLLNGKRQPGKFAYNYSQHYTCNSLNSFHHWYSCCYASLHPFSQGPCTGLTRTCSASELCACACPVTCACPGLQLEGSLQAGAPGLHGTCGMKAQNTCFWDQYNTQAPGHGGRVVYSCCGYCSCRHLWKVCILLRVLVHFKSFQVKSGKSDWRSSRLALQWKTKQAQSV